MTNATRVIGLSVSPGEVDVWVPEIERAITQSGRDLRIDAAAAPDQIDYLVYNIDGGLVEFWAYPRLRLILNTWAGVEAAVAQINWPEHVKFCRMAESGMTEGMSEYFTGHALRYHLDIDRFQAQSAKGVWKKWAPPLARNRTIGILGLGVLGQATAAKLNALGFQVHGWSRSAKNIPDITCHHGDAGLMDILSQSEILILILPLTPTTEGLMNADTLGVLPEGACIINAGRGPLIDDDALLAALASRHVRHATLDVFREEPLPPEHRYWRHPHVTVTPHIAAETRFDTAAQSILAQIGRDMDGLSPEHVVDRARGY